MPTALRLASPALKKEISTRSSRTRSRPTDAFQKSKQLPEIICICVNFSHVMITVQKSQFGGQAGC